MGALIIAIVAFTVGIFFAAVFSMVAE